MQLKENNPEYTKEYFFLALEWQNQSAANADKHKWQLRLGWAVLSATFLGACATSQDFRSLQFDHWSLPVLANLIFFCLFFFYDCHLTHVFESVTNRVKQIKQRIAQSPSELPVDLFLQDIRKKYDEMPWSLLPKKGHRPWVKFRAAKSLDFLLFYLFTGLFWIAGWLIKFGVGVLTEKC